MIEIVDSPCWRVANTSRSPSGDQEGDESYPSVPVSSHSSVTREPTIRLMAIPPTGRGQDAGSTSAMRPFRDHESENPSPPARRIFPLARSRTCIPAKLLKPPGPVVALKRSLSPVGDQATLAMMLQ
jgi:hypothetical protein